MNYARLLVRMSQLVRRPPSLGRVILVFGVIAACLALVGVETLGLWPESWRVERVRVP